MNIQSPTRYPLSARTIAVWVCTMLLVSACGSKAPPPSSAPQGQWISIFNGQNLDGWTAKIAGHAVGENYADTFRVENGILRIAYDKYGQFGEQFGGL
ncbi:MAG: DUF1080 domain-containing protein, partial [Steroidobacteraceae bacterium]